MRLYGLETYLIQMPVNRISKDIADRATNHCKWLADKFPINIHAYLHDLSNVYNDFVYSHPLNSTMPELAKINLASRFRMCTLYTYSSTFDCLVAGTGNKVEDYGLGFFTKYGDGGVDISPIGDLLKTEVQELAEFLGVHLDIVTATPTDELWPDSRSDEQQIGASYPAIESAMKLYDEWKHYISFPYHAEFTLEEYIKKRFDNPDSWLRIMKIYVQRHENNSHKMAMPPICKVEKN